MSSSEIGKRCLRIRCFSSHPGLRVSRAPQPPNRAAKEAEVLYSHSVRPSGDRNVSLWRHPAVKAG